MSFLYKYLLCSCSDKLCSLRVSLTIVSYIVTENDIDCYFLEKINIFTFMNAVFKGLGVVTVDDALSLTLPAKKKKKKKINI